MNWDMPKVIGHNARQRRLELEMDATTFGQEMQRLLGKPWKRQTVSALESGDRAMTANDVAVLAWVLDTTVAKLFTPPIEVRTIQIGGSAFDRTAFTAFSLTSAADGALTGFEADLTYIWARAEEARLGLQDVRDMLSMLQDQIQGYRLTGEAPPGVIRKLEAKSAELQAKLQKYNSLEDEGEDDGEGN